MYHLLANIAKAFKAYGIEMYSLRGKLIDD